MKKVKISITLEGNEAEAYLKVLEMLKPLDSVRNINIRAFRIGLQNIMRLILAYNTKKEKC